MGWPVEWLKRMISADEFDRWCAYYKHHPFDDQSNHHVPIASLQATVANMLGGKHKLTDFMIYRERRETSSMSLDDKLKAFFRGRRESGS